MSSNDLLDDEFQPAQASSYTPPCVLHVEDDKDFSEAVKIRLEAHGVAVVRAFDGHDAIRQAIKFSCDVVLLDFEMPYAKGDEVLKTLRENELTRELPVIMLTGRRDAELERRMAELGVCAFLTKPLRFDALREQLARLIPVLERPSCR